MPNEAVPVAGEAVPCIRPGHQHRTSAMYATANLASLFTVCALAINEAEEWSDEIRKNLMQDIKHVLEMGALLAEDAGALAEKQGATKGERE